MRQKLCVVRWYLTKEYQFDEKNSQKMVTVADTKTQQEQICMFLPSNEGMIKKVLSSWPHIDWDFLRKPTRTVRSAEESKEGTVVLLEII